MTEKLCCPECFGDNGLRENLIPSCETTSGTCDFCGSTGDWLIKPSELADWFEMLVNVYERNESGKSLIECMKSDWELFTHRRMVTPRATELLAEILDDGDIVLQSFIPSPNYTSEGLAQWETMRDEMMYSNRWFLDTSLDLERLRQLLDLLLAVELPQKLVSCSDKDERRAVLDRHDGCSAAAECSSRSREPCRDSLSLSWIFTRDRCSRDSPTYRRGCMCG